MEGKVKIVIDGEIPFIKGVFEPYAEVVYVKSDGFARDLVADADALVIRSRTQCGSDLLEGTSVKFVATDTIVTSHIDFDYCRAHGIIIRSATGSNAGAVMNYVFSALYGSASRKGINLEGGTIGIIGLGNVGSRVERTANYLGIDTLRYDPIRQAHDGPHGFCDLDYLLANSDVVTLHPSVSVQTRRMANDSFFGKMKDGAIFINTSNGELVDDEALKRAIPRLGPVIIDTWNHEPDVDRELLDLVDIATPHIAAYSYQGKQNGTAMCVRSLSRYFGFKDLFDFFPKTEIQELESIKLDLKGKTQGEITSVLQYNYPIFSDDFMFRLAPDSFSELRSNYQYRREFYVD